MLNLRNFVLLSLVVLTVVVLTRETETTTEAPARVAALLQEDFDYYITSMSSRRFDLTGKLTYKLDATRVTHYPETDLVKLENPEFFYFEDEAAPWELAATTGNLSNHPVRNEQHLELLSDVSVRRPMEDGNFVTVTTEKLDVFPDSEEVTTESPVTLEAKGSRLEGIGMRAFFNEERIDLFNTVRGSYQ
jgi:lipopolysaccharide export system protein LptC